MANQVLHVARTSAQLSHLNTLDLRPEVRRILLAEGAGFHNDQKHYDYKIPDRLIDTKGSGLQRYPSLQIDVKDYAGFSYTNYSQGVRYEVERTDQRQRFIQGLEDPDVFVIYTGHARYGRGACFGRVWNGPEYGPSTGEIWRTGLFRKGYPFIAIPVSEIISHSFTAPVVKASVPLVAGDCDPLLRRNLSQLKQVSVTKLEENLKVRLLPLMEDLRPDDIVWTMRAYQHGKTESFLVLRAGWEHTDRHPYDLGGTNIQCRGFFDCGCSTEQLNREIVVERKGFSQEEDRHYSFFTTGPSDMFDALSFLYHMLSYPEQSRGRPWAPMLAYAKLHANKDLARWPHSTSTIK